MRSSAEPSPAGRPPTCGEVAELLPALVDLPLGRTATWSGTPTTPPGPATADPAVGEEVVAHVGTCLRCQAELARYRRLLARLHQLRGDVVAPLPSSVAAVLAALEEAGDHGAVRSLLHSRAAAYVGGAVVATAAASAGMLVWVNRRRMELAS
jgi:hypothetical protein